MTTDDPALKTWPSLEAARHSPHEPHDWDSSQTPILFNGTIDGKSRKLVSTPGDALSIRIADFG
jgi:hypothetical protein